MTLLPSLLPPPLALDGELFQPSAWVRRGLLAVVLITASLSVLTLAAPSTAISLRIALAASLCCLGGIALRAWWRCRDQYLVTERTITHLRSGCAARTISFAEVLDLRELPTWWGGRRLCLKHADGALEIDASFLAPHGGRLFATLRHRLRPQFFRWIDDILSRGERFAVRPGAMVVMLGQAAAAIWLGWLLTGSPARWVAVPVALWLAVLQVDAATTVVRLGPGGLSLRSLMRRRSVQSGQVHHVLFQSRTRLLGRAERIIVLQCERFDLRMIDALTGFEALAGALEGFSRHRELRGLAQL
ncbi:MAG: hypothetical protein U1E76_01290 [Planctomycetota bacterium]